MNGKARVAVLQYFAIVAQHHIGLTLSTNKLGMIELHLAGRSRLNGGTCNDQSTVHPVQLTKGSMLRSRRAVNQEDKNIKNDPRLVHHLNTLNSLRLYLRPGAIPGFAGLGYITMYYHAQQCINKQDPVFGVGTHTYRSPQCGTTLGLGRLREGRTIRLLC